MVQELGSYTHTGDQVEAPDTAAIWESKPVDGIPLCVFLFSLNLSGKHENLKTKHKN